MSICFSLGLQCQVYGVCVCVCVCVCVLKERKRIHTLVHPVAEQSVKGSLLSATHYLVALKLI